MLRKALCAILTVVLILNLSSITVSASDMEEIGDIDINIGAENESSQASTIAATAKSALLMDAKTGTVLFSKNAHEALSPASVTKVMTLLLVAEALRDGSITPDQSVTVSENAASMGGSQIFIKEGERFTVEELIKSTVIASANDAAVSLAELIAGSEAAFVEKMNTRAEELGMKNTHFENATGLDDTVTNHLTSAYDIAIMSRELIKHDIILKYSNVWQDSIRNGDFILTNTNRLVRYYSGCTGLKTGSTDKAGFCISATAERDGMHLIAVIMGAPTRDERNNCARGMLDYGFATYALYTDPECELESVPVKRGTEQYVTVCSSEFSILINKSDMRKVEKTYDIPEALIAPISDGAKIGETVYTLNGNEIGRSPICASKQIDRIRFSHLLLKIFEEIIVGYRR